MHYIMQDGRLKLQLLENDYMGRIYRYWKMPVQASEWNLQVLENAGTGKCRYWKMQVLKNAFSSTCIFQSLLFLVPLFSSPCKSRPNACTVIFQYLPIPL